MLRKQMSVMLIYLLLLTIAAPFVAAQSDNAAKVKAQVFKLTAGEKKKVKVKTVDGRSLKVYISRAEADSFDLTDSKNGQISTLAYRDVSSVKKSGGLSTGSIIAIAAGAGAAIVVLSIVGRYCRNEGCLGF